MHQRDRATIELDGIEEHRRELTGYCYRMLGSSAEADDAAQETIVRAWQAADRFEGRSSLRSWLYRIATNVCLDALRGRNRRARPMEMGPVREPAQFTGAVLPDASWLEPVPDARVLPESSDPAEVVATRETIRLAFVAALQHLPPRQRAVLLLCEVLRVPAAEVAGLLDLTVASVNSALQRARATLDARRPEAEGIAPRHGVDDELLARYVDAFERYDIPRLVELLHAEVVMSMPPYDFWLRGHRSIAEWMVGPGAACEGSRLVPVEVSGGRGFASYKPDGEGAHRAWSIQVLELRDGVIAGYHHFLDTERFADFGLPLVLPAG